MPDSSEVIKFETLKSKLAIEATTSIVETFYKQRSKSFYIERTLFCHPQACTLVIPDSDRESKKISTINQTLNSQRE